MKKINDIPHTQTLRAAVDAHNDVASRKDIGLLRGLFVTGTSEYDLRDARELVRSSFQEFLTRNPNDNHRDIVKAWVINNAAEPVQLLKHIEQGRV